MYKVGIMTWFQHRNYGTALQAVAMSEIIKKIGYSPTVIQYYYDKVEPYDEMQKIKRVIRKVIDRFDSTVIQPYISKERENKFEEFLLYYLSFSAECRTLSELEALNSEFDCFVCGSDQIWGTAYFKPHYFLDFVYDDYKKIAYAPSIGTPKIDDKRVGKEVARLCSSFAYLSTREEAGSKIIHDLTGRDVKTVLDPTLLLYEDDWNKLLDSKYELPQSPYLIVYMLGYNESHWKKAYDIAEKLNLNVKIIPVFQNDIERQGCITYTVGPSEFLSLIKNAAYVCTDSFHGMAISVIFNKQFTVFERFKKHDSSNQNSRVYNLADKLELNNRIYHRSSDTKMIYAEIDYKRVNDTRRMLADESLDYLKTALETSASSKTERKNNVRKNYTLCCGCGSCKSVCSADAIEVKMNKDGFYEAFIDNERCISCGKCIKVCPYASNYFSKHITQGTIYSFKSKSMDVLLKSSSGGAAYHISRTMQQNGYSVVGCTYDVAQQKARHIVIEPGEKDGLSRLQGSKYMQSEFAPVADQIYRNKDKKYLIIGTPCQIAGARNLLKDRTNVIYVDLICHGVPTYHLFRKYQDYLKRKKGIAPDNLEIVFRDKRFGWRERYIYAHDSTHENIAHKNKDPYFLSFEHGFCYSHSCYECPWRDCSAADLRLGDYWHKKFEKDKTGVSEVVAMTESGRKIIEEMQVEGIAEIIPQQIEDYTTVQQMTNHREPAFWHEYIDELENADVTLEKSHKKYILPAEKMQRLKRITYKLINKIRG